MTAYNRSCCSRHTAGDAKRSKATMGAADGRELSRLRGSEGVAGGLGSLALVAQNGRDGRRHRNGWLVV